MSSVPEPKSCQSNEPRSPSCFVCAGGDASEDGKPLPEKSPTDIVDGGLAVNPIPTDKGWAWVVCVGCFFITFIMSVYDQVLAVIFVDVVDKFDVSVSTATVVFTIHAITFSVGSVISTNILVSKFGVRVVIVVAAVFNSLSTIVIAFSPNITFYLVVHLFKGLSVGSMWIPALGLLGHYFKRCRSVATSITNIGISVSLLVTPLFVRELLDHLGFFGSLLIVSGVEMQAVFIAMLLRPPSSYTRRKKNMNLGPHRITNQEREEYSLLKTAEAEVMFKGNDTALYDTVCSCSLQQTRETDHYLNDERDTPFMSGCRDDSQSSQISCENESIRNALSKDADNSERNCLQKPVHDQEQYISINSKQECVYLLPDRTHHDLNCPAKTETQNKSLLQKKHSHIKSEINQNQQEKTVCSSDIKHRSCLFVVCDVLKNIFDFKLLNDWLMRFLLASTVFGALLQYIPTYIPTMAVRKGLDKTQAAVLLTICGGVNLISTLLQGFVIDSKVITAAKYVAICQCIVGTMCHLTHFFTSFPTLVLLSVSHGMFGGARLSLMPVVAMDFLGVNNLSKALGFNAMIATLSLSLHHPFLGFLLQATSSFAVSFHYVGFALYISAGLLLVENIGRKLNNRRAHHEHNK